MNNTSTLKITKHRNLLTIFLFLCASLFMYNFYKCLSGFVANKFEEPLKMFTMIINYIIPVFAFLFFFYEYYIKKINKTVSLIYSITLICGSLFSLYGIIKYFKVFASNNELGVYGSLLGILIKFPFDGIVINILLIAVQIFNLITTFKPNHKYSYLKEQLYNHGYFKINLIEYLFYSILAILTFFTIGDFISGLRLLPNIRYDGKIIFLLLWLLIIPLMNLISYVFKFENRINKISHKMTYLLSLIGINILFGLLFYLFESIDPNFIVSIGKPLFPITYSISFPIEIIALLLIQGISVIIGLAKIILINLKKNER